MLTMTIEFANAEAQRLYYMTAESLWANYRDNNVSPDGDIGRQAKRIGRLIDVIAPIDADGIKYPRTYELDAALWAVADTILESCFDDAMLDMAEADRDDIVEDDITIKIADGMLSDRQALELAIQALDEQLLGGVFSPIVNDRLIRQAIAILSVMSMMTD